MSSKIVISSSSSSSELAWHAIETAPPRMIQIGRRPAVGPMEKRLETIHEDTEVHHSSSYNRKLPPAGFEATMADLSKRSTPFMVAR
ncbi:hypothetical protein BVC80_1651g101 [Macleaya cordata]|uniref:Uncharacterized protein n=1 Tax=Macleaya cordata TaxID=56857 RepID=A0A200PZG5_MACCD|nr:hypothetical protein BVC80_1651g101 [Macleaya cordata]